LLLKLGGHISNCLERAADAEKRALQAADSATRGDNELLAQSWRHLARSYQFVESLERYLSETDRNKKEIIPPEMLAAVEEQPVIPQGQPIIRRRRIKHEASFKDRLLKSAQDAREQAARLPSGAARDRELQKARQSETAATIDTWVSSPGSRPPANFDPSSTKKPRA
jgi:hypothetical protein